MITWDELVLSPPHQAVLSAHYLFSQQSAKLKNGIGSLQDSLHHLLHSSSFPGVLGYIDLIIGSARSHRRQDNVQVSHDMCAPFHTGIPKV